MSLESVSVERSPVNDPSVDASVSGQSDEQFCRYLIEFLMKALVVCLVSFFGCRHLFYAGEMRFWCLVHGSLGQGIEFS